MSESEDSGKREAKPGARYPTFVGLAFLALVVYATINTISNDEGGVLGADPTERGSPLPEFAVPAVDGDLDGDANVFQDDCETGENPCPEPRTPACEVDEPGALRVCDYFDRPLAISFWFTRGGDCLPSQDEFNAVAQRYSDRVNFLSVNVRDDREEVRDIVAEHGWDVPVGWDRDGAVSNIYRVGLCPTVALAFPGGILQRALLGSEAVSEGALAEALDGLLAESRERLAVR